MTETAKSLGIARKTLTDLFQGHSGLNAEMALTLAAASATEPNIGSKTIKVRIYQ